MSKINKTIVTLRKDITYDSYDIDEFLKLITDAKTNGATRVDFESETEWDISKTSLWCTYQREETEDEYQERLNNEQRKKESTKQWAIREIERLQKYVE